jgi:hypothetical protein
MLNAYAQSLRCLFFTLCIISLAGCGSGDSKEESSPITPSVIDDNHPPQISGQPKAINVAEAFEFKPQISDPDNDSLTLTVENLPSWLSFDKTRGMIFGNAEQAGTYSNIHFTVSDGQLTAVLIINVQVFSHDIQPNSPPRVTSTPEQAFESKEFVYHATFVDAENDDVNILDTRLPAWLNVDLKSHTFSGTPMSTDVGEQVIGFTFSDGHTEHSIEQTITVVAKVINKVMSITSTPNSAYEGQLYQYVLSFDDPEGDTVSVSNLSKPRWLMFDAASNTFSGTPGFEDVAQQRLEFDYSDGENNASVIQLFSVVARENASPVVSPLTADARAQEVFQVSLTSYDADNDSVHLTVEGLPAWLSFDDQTNTLWGTPTQADSGALDFTVHASDGRSSSVYTFNLTVSASYVDLALESGNAFDVPNSERLLDAALEEIGTHQARLNAIKSTLFGYDSTAPLTALSWNPTWDATLMQATFPFNQPILLTNNSWQEGYETKIRNLAIVGSDEHNQGRYLVFGSNPYRNVINTEMEQFLKNSHTWLGKLEFSQTLPLNIVMTQLDESYYFRDRSATRAWFDAHYQGAVHYNEATACDNEALAACINDDVDLLVISGHETTGLDIERVIDSVKQALANNIGVIYIQRDGSQTALSKALFELLHVSVIGDNYWHRLELANWDPKQIAQVLPEEVQALQNLMTQFKDGEFNIDLSGCDKRSCPSESYYQEQFYSVATYINARFRHVDKAKIDIFTHSGYRLDKLLALLADHYRGEVRFPMDKLTTPNSAFFRALFADHAVLNMRKISPAQPDMGNFSRSNFSHVQRENVTVNMTSKPHFRSTGVYALPGQTFSIKRTDDQAPSTHFFINTLRDSATHYMSNNKYNRPAKLQSVHIPIESNETVYFTSAYGGPIQIAFTDNNYPVSFEFKDVARHPYWRSDADNERFAQQLEKGDFDWAELATDGFEVHSKLEKMRKSVNEGHWPIASDFAQATKRYMHNYPHVLAGFKGLGIDVVSEIHDFADARSLEIQTIDIVKHMNADQPTCGAGCSGNPYDAGWNFNPTGHGDIHELGHGLEKGRFRIEGFGGHSNTNFYSYYSKSRFEDETGHSASCQSLPFEALFNHLQASQNTPDPFVYMQQLGLSAWSQSHAIYIQVMMAAQAYNKLENGWHLYPRLHIVERAFNHADNNEASWQADKDALGFSSYSMDEARQIGNNDWLLIVLSEATQLDLTDYFTMWGMATSEKAKWQVRSNNYTLLGNVYFASSAKGYCTELTQPMLQVDGEQTWP